MKRVLSKCHVCRHYNATLGEQVTAQLSMVQVSSDSHRIIYSFAAVGLDILDRFTKEVGPRQDRGRMLPQPSVTNTCLLA